MRRTPILICLIGAGVLGVGSGCQQSAATQAASSAAAAVIQGGQAVAAAMVPPSVMTQAIQLLQANNLNWGRPQAIYTADQMYVFVYRTPTSIFRHGSPRVLVVDALGRTARLQRLQEQALQ